MDEKLGPALKRQLNQSSWKALAYRLATAFGLLFTVFCLLWFDRGGLRDQVDGQLSIPDVIYFTMITITTVGYGDIVPVSERARLIDAFLITPIRLFVWLIFLGTAFDMLFKKSLERWRMRRIQQKLCGHTIIAGFGRSGSTAARAMLAGGVAPAKMVVIDCSAEACAAALELGIAVMEGDASSNVLLEAAHVDSASSMIVSAGRDDTAILIVLTARSLAATLPIAVTITAADNEDIARNAGANHVINPIEVAGRLLADAVIDKRSRPPVF